MPSNGSGAAGDQELMRVYGSVMWALGKVLRGVPEVPKLVVGSFWDAEMPFEDDDEVEDGEAK